ncbi:hypothetical protein SKAU_G00366990 [Synaphobranchus kaupii]|uniref:Dynein heavy chain tail domain-containing protein n=1 Tax=Synaphobranchus kaupii TaxID=118154 RepID=A0A9Q1EF90_SYNKA|nr:hypothetical protein SKAU_G00366990 [Synaphobranchus kaupii]
MADLETQRSGRSSSSKAKHPGAAKKRHKGKHSKGKLLREVQEIKELLLSEEMPELTCQMEAEVEDEAFYSRRLRNRFKKCVDLRGVTTDSWTEEHDQALDSFASDASVRVLVVYLDPSTGLRVDFSLPAEQVEEQVAYFIRTEEMVIIEENFESMVHFGSLWGRGMEQLLWHLNGVHVPLVTLSKAWPESIKNNYTANLHRFLTNLTDTRFKLEGKTVLYIPMEALLFKPEVAAKDKELVQRMEVVMIHWTRQIKEVINAQKTLETGESSGPLEEITFWRSRCLDLTGISHQLEKPGVSHVQAILQLCKSTYIPAFCKLTKHIQESSLQAQSNLTFLSLLREPCEEMAGLKPPGRGAQTGPRPQTRPLHLDQLQVLQHPRAAHFSLPQGEQ